MIYNFLSQSTVSIRWRLVFKGGSYLRNTVVRLCRTSSCSLLSDVSKVSIFKFSVQYKRLITFCQENIVLQIFGPAKFFSLFPSYFHFQSETNKSIKRVISTFLFQKYRCWHFEFFLKSWWASCPTACSHCEYFISIELLVWLNCAKYCRTLCNVVLH